MLLAKVDCMSWFHRALLQVPDLEIFRLVYREELADTGCEPGIFALLLGDDLFVLLGCRGVAIIEVEEAPLDLRDGRLAFLVPHGHWRSVLLVIEAVKNEING